MLTSCLTDGSPGAVAEWIHGGCWSACFQQRHCSGRPLAGWEAAGEAASRAVRCIGGGSLPGGSSCSASTGVLHIPHDIHLLMLKPTFIWSSVQLLTAGAHGCVLAGLRHATSCMGFGGWNGCRIYVQVSTRFRVSISGAARCSACPAGSHSLGHTPGKGSAAGKIDTSAADGPGLPSLSGTPDRHSGCSVRRPASVHCTDSLSHGIDGYVAPAPLKPALLECPLTHRAFQPDVISCLPAGPCELPVLQVQRHLQLDEPLAESFMTFSQASSVLLFTVYGTAVATLPAASGIRQYLPAAFVLAGAIAALLCSQAQVEWLPS